MALTATVGVAAAAPAPAPGGKAAASSHGKVTDNLYMPLGAFEDATSGKDPKVKAMIDRKDIGGVQVVVPWKALEGKKGEYKWSRLDSALKYLQERHKKLFVQVQDRFFDVEMKDANVPQYVKDEGGLAPTIDENPDVVTSHGAMAAQWNKDVRASFQGLLKAMAEKFDGKLAGVNLPETAVEVDTKKDKTEYTSKSYIDAEIDNMAYGKKVFTKTQFIQYINFLPDDDDHKRMKEMFDLARDKKIGIGGPDTLPDRPYQMENSYKFLHEYKDALPLVAMAVQEPDINAKDPKTGKPYTRERFTDFARDYLGARQLFWTTEADWLQKPAA
ncbi:hypothetical protein [Streptomyces sp. UNOC14_S4]|uniref:hypothetical protein n=1 Tax=Streptomyces sp. UNOC14_S4 TaxID=2872340 RepID=UPI001E5BC25A|nr:hypothetical protein [Streptomyces sp. UNOC14_S4]MCC3766702.1 hypothetical protein [Streptomyces sp. UNOC14_S4]